jgi:hypothetical protein
MITSHHKTTKERTLDCRPTSVQSAEAHSQRSAIRAVAPMHERIPHALPQVLMFWPLSKRHSTRRPSRRRAFPIIHTAVADAAHLAADISVPVVVTLAISIREVQDPACEQLYLALSLFGVLVRVARQPRTRASRVQGAVADTRAG